MSVGASTAVVRTREHRRRDALQRLLTWGEGVDGRLVFLGIVAGYLLAVVAGRLLWGVDFWHVLGVPSRPTPFFDARNLTAAWECQRLGYDPLYENPCDPRGRPLMYLRPWLLLGVLGLDQSDTVVLAAVLIVLMFLSFAVLVRRVPAGSGVVLAIAACSPAIMFAVERANMDIALFTLIAAAILLWRAFPRAGQFLGPALVLVAATAKLYPVFALPAFIFTRSRTTPRVALVCVAAFTIYCAATFRDIAHVGEIATQGDHLSYGARILPAHLYHQVGADRWGGPGAVKQLIAVAPLMVIGAAAAIYARRRLAARGNAIAIDDASLLAFHAGALIYLGTFAVANNFDYRLVFLLLTLPQLMAWGRAPTLALSRLASWALVAVLVLLWVGSLSQRLHLWDELATWVVAGLLAALLAATVPRFDSLREAILNGARPASRTT